MIKEERRVIDSIFVSQGQSFYDGVYEEGIVRRNRTKTYDKETPDSTHGLKLQLEIAENSEKKEQNNERQSYIVF